MSNISGKETKPEILVRKYLFTKGFRYRKNVKDLPGKPDIVLSKSKIVIFVHGCFWHGHSCNMGTRPTSNIEFWNKKIQSNIDRDKRVIKDLTNAGWNVIILWNCELKNKDVFETTMNNLIVKLSGIISKNK